MNLPLALRVDEKVADVALLVELVQGDGTPGGLRLSLKDDGGLLLLLGASDEPAFDNTKMKMRAGLTQQGHVDKNNLK